MSFEVFIWLCIAGLLALYALVGLLLRWLVTSVLNHFEKRWARAKAQ